MKKIYFFLLSILLFFSCGDDNISKKLPANNFCGYGVLLYSKSFHGPVRYMEFYPMIKANRPDVNFAKKIGISIKNGIIIRGSNSTQLWQDLRKSNNKNPDEYGFYKALIFLDLSDNKLKYNYKSPIPNEVIIQNKVFKTRTYDYFTFGKCNIASYKILRSL